MKTINFTISFYQSEKCKTLFFTEKCVDLDAEVVFECRVRSLVLSLNELVDGLCVTRTTSEDITDFSKFS